MISKSRLFALALLVVCAPILVTGCLDRDSEPLFPSIADLVVGSDGSIYALGGFPPSLVYQYDKSGRFVRELGAARHTRAWNPVALAKDNQGKIYVADTTGVWRFDDRGNVERHFPIGGTTFDPSCIVVAENGDMFIVNGVRLERYDRAGNLKNLVWTISSAPDDQLRISTALARNGNLLLGVSRFAVIPDDFGWIREITPEGRQVREIAGYDSADDRKLASKLYDLATDADGNIYAVDYTYVWKLSSTGQVLKKWLIPSTKEDSTPDPMSITTDSSGYVYVGTAHDGRILKFDPSGQLVTKWQMNRVK